MLSLQFDTEIATSTNRSERDEVLQPSSLRSFHWPEKNPEEVNQPVRCRTHADRQMVQEAATAVAFDLDRFLRNTRHLDVAGQVHFLLTSERFQFNQVGAVRSERLWQTRIRAMVDAGIAIRLVYPLFCKIGNWAKQMSSIGPNAGEDATIFFFSHINTLVKLIYPPGIAIAAVTDAQLYNSAFQNPEVEVATYLAVLKQRVAELNAEGCVTLYNYVDLLANDARRYREAHHHHQHLMHDRPADALAGVNVETLFQSVKASINTRKYTIPYSDAREIFSADENPDNRYYGIVDQMTTRAFEEVVAIRMACSELNSFEQIWPGHVRATCHKGTKNGLAVIGLRPYPEYYGSSKLLPYHGVPIITHNKSRLRLDIEPEVMLRDRQDLVRVVDQNAETYFYDGTLATVGGSVGHEKKGSSNVAVKQSTGPPFAA